VQIRGLGIACRPSVRLSAYPGTAQFFGVLPIILGTGKATDFKFCRNIQGRSEQKPMKMLGIVAVGRVRIQGVPKIFRALICTVGLITRSFLR